MIVSMKKSLLALSALLFWAGITDSNAVWAPKYRWHFQPNTSNPCWSSGEYYYTGGSNPVNQSDPPLTIANGDSLIVGILPDGGCCSSNPQTIGYTWADVSYDNGITWSYSTTMNPLNMSALTSSEKWTFTTGTTLGIQAQNLVQCNPGGGN